MVTPVLYRIIRRVTTTPHTTHASVCKAFDHPVPVLDKYVQDRDLVLDDIKAFYDCTRDDAKTLVLRYLHGGKVNKWLSDAGIRDELCAKAAREGHCPVVMQLETECKQVCKFFLDTFPQFKSLLDQINAKRVSEGKDPKGAASGLAHGLQDLEDRLLQRLETFLAAKGYEVGSLEYDGVKVFRDGATGPFPDAILHEAESVLATHNLGSATQSLFIPMKLAEKPMASKYQGFVDNAPSQPAETQAELGRIGDALSDAASAPSPVRDALLQRVRGGATSADFAAARHGLMQQLGQDVGPQNLDPKFSSVSKRNVAVGSPTATGSSATQVSPVIARGASTQTIAPAQQGRPAAAAHPLMDRMRIGVDRGNARGNKTLFFSASAPPIARHTSPPDCAAAPHTPTRRLRAHEQLAESVGTAPLQLGSRQPCRPPPHTRAGMAAACVPGLSRPPSRGGSRPLQATGVAGARVRGRPKLREQLRKMRTRAPGGRSNALQRAGPARTAATKSVTFRARKALRKCRLPLVFSRSTPSS
eukprot:COSAG06_NODE_6634_length_2846_cov_15.101929_4_plen_531_part_00